MRIIVPSLSFDREYTVIISDSISFASRCPDRKLLKISGSYKLQHPFLQTKMLSGHVITSNSEAGVILTAKAPSPAIVYQGQSVTEAKTFNGVSVPIVHEFYHSGRLHVDVAHVISSQTVHKQIRRWAFEKIGRNADAGIEIMPETVCHTACHIELLDLDCR